jgi:hypothetical protein
MPEPTYQPSPQPTPQPTFEEATFSKAAQLLADPLTDSTRKRQTFLLLLSLLSLFVFFGIVSPEKVSLGPVDVKLDTPRTPSGAPSTSLTTVAANALRFNKVLCLVLIYALVVFSFSAYRDYKAAGYLAKVPLSELTRSGREQIAASQEKRLALQTSMDRLNRLSEERDKQWNAVSLRMQQVEDEFKKRREPLTEAGKKALAELELLRTDHSERGDRAKRAVEENSEQFGILSQQERAAMKPLLDERDTLLDDPGIAKLRTQILERKTEMEAVRLADKTALLADVFGMHSRWKKFWFFLEVLSPLALGVAAILIPARTFW